MISQVLCKTFFLPTRDFSKTVHETPIALDFENPHMVKIIDQVLTNMYIIKGFDLNYHSSERKTLMTLTLKLFLR